MKTFRILAPLGAAIAFLGLMAGTAAADPEQNNTQVANNVAYVDQDATALNIGSPVIAAGLNFNLGGLLVGQSNDVSAAGAVASNSSNIEQENNQLQIVKNKFSFNRFW